MSKVVRYLGEQVLQDLKEKMVFLGGPRQVGKTTLAKTLPEGIHGYLNYDVDADRSKILDKTLPTSSLWIFDEIHKFKRWRNYLKGIYDSKSPEQKILVTGSARLDLYRYGGDSLQGRYHYLRLHPLSLAELKSSQQSTLDQLFQLGGFPEPFFSASEEKAKRWSMQYRQRVIRDEIPALEQVQDIDSIELLAKSLPERVGSPLSINSLREDLHIAHATAERWVKVLERIYSIFRISPFGSPLLRAVKREQKHYHLDWTIVKDRGFRFENMVACHLLKWVNYQEDCKGNEWTLKFFRDEEAREVDFVICDDKRPLMIIECKLSDASPNSALKYFKLRFPEVKAYQISLEGIKDYQTPEGIRVCPAREFLKDLI